MVTMVPIPQKNGSINLWAAPYIYLREMFITGRCSIMYCITPIPIFMVTMRILTQEGSFVFLNMLPGINFTSFSNITRFSYMDYSLLTGRLQQISNIPKDTLPLNYLMATYQAR